LIDASYILAALSQLTVVMSFSRNVYIGLLYIGLHRSIGVLTDTSHAATVTVPAPSTYSCRA